MESPCPGCVPIASGRPSPPAAGRFAGPAIRRAALCLSQDLPRDSSARLLARPLEEEGESLEDLIPISAIPIEPSGSQSPELRPRLLLPPVRVDSAVLWLRLPTSAFEETGPAELHACSG